MGNTMPLKGTGLFLLTLTIAVLVLSYLFVIARLATRKAIKALGWDDYLMLLGLLLFTVCSSMLIGMAYNGGGYLLSELSSATRMTGIKFYFLAQVTYCITTIPIKCSICFTLLRIADNKKWHVFVLQGIMALSIVSGIATFIGVMLACRPLPSFWGEVEGTCSASVSIGIGYFLSASCICTDFVLAILPAVILWHIQLKTRVKVYIIIILGLGALASGATIVRLRFLTRYAEPDRILKTGAPLSCWTVTEIGIGICAGSLAQLRPLLRFVPFIKHSSYAGTSDVNPSKTLRSRPGNVKLATLHKESSKATTSDSSRRFHGRDELDLASDSDSQDERLNNPGRSTSAAGINDDLEAGGTIRKETEVTVQPWVPSGQNGSSIASAEVEPTSPDFTFRDTHCKTEIWHRGPL